MSPVMAYRLLFAALVALNVAAAIIAVAVTR